MISLEDMRRIGPTLANLSDEELSDLRGDLYQLAQEAFRDWGEGSGQDSDGFLQAIINPEYDIPD